MSFQIHTVVSSPFEENSYLLWRKGQDSCVVVDPGMEPELILDFLQQESLSISAILNTHGHADHIAGNAAMKQAFPDAPLVIGLRDAPLLTDPQLNLSRSYGFDIFSPVADQLVQEGDRLTFAGIDFEVLDIPGHSPGHVVFLIREDPITVLGGDVLFRESIGRTDFPGGSLQLLKSGIRKKLFTLADSTLIYPGHGPVTTIAHEKEYNPFLR